MIIKHGDDNKAKVLSVVEGKDSAADEKARRALEDVKKEQVKKASEN